MQITLDQNSISEAIQVAVRAAVIDGLTSWNIKKSISESAQTAIENVNLPRLVVEYAALI